MSVADGEVEAGFQSGSGGPSSTLVPSMRTTMGTWMLRSRAAATTPVASVSQRRMPPKMLIKTAFTCVIGEQDAEGVLDLLGAGAAADVEEVGRDCRPRT